jgi:hypothetical protein
VEAVTTSRYSRLKLEKLEAERILAEWALCHADRDKVVRLAHQAGISKHRIYEVTGIARTTIDRIVRAQ